MSLWQAIGRFLEWWVGELSELIPQRFRRNEEQKRSRLVLQIDDDALVLIHCQGPGQEKLARLALKPDSKEANQHLLNQLGLSPEVLADTTLRLPRARILHKVLQLPQTVEENLRQVLEYEMDRLTPFRADQVYYDCHVLGRAQKSGQINIELMVVPRSYIDPLLAKIEFLGFRPAVVDVEGGDSRNTSSYCRASANLCPPGKQLREQNWGRWGNLLLASLTGILLIVALAIPLLQGRSTLGALEEKLKVTGQRTLHTSALATELNSGVGELRFLLQKKTEGPAIIEVLDELTRILPDGTWLQRLEIQGTELKIQGESDVASNLISVIEASTRFRNAQFRSPVTQSGRTNSERFQISAELNAGIVP